MMVHVDATKETIAFRLIGSACTKYNSSDECSGMQCDFGPCGAAIQGVTTDTVNPPTTDARVFHPEHAVMTCISRKKPGITITVTGIVDGRPGA